MNEVVTHVVGDYLKRRFFVGCFFVFKRFTRSFQIVSQIVSNKGHNNLLIQIESVVKDEGEGRKMFL